MQLQNEPYHHDPPSSLVQALGRALIDGLCAAGQGLLILLEALAWHVRLPRRRADVIRQLYMVGIKSFPVTAVVALFTGMILSLQTGLELRDYGQEVRVGTIVVQTMCREMGPFMTALILAASVGAAMAAELGTMRVSEEIDALYVMAINPIDYLVMPRLFAMMVMAPVLTIFANIIGTAGGGIVAVTQLSVSWDAYLRNAFEFVGNKEIFVGLLKAFVFGIIIAVVSCYQGMMTTNGAVGVGISTRKAVVYCFLYVLIIGYFITRLFY